MFVLVAHQFDDDAPPTLKITTPSASANIVPSTIGVPPIRTSSCRQRQVPRGISPGNDHFYPPPALQTCFFQHLNRCNNKSPLSPDVLTVNISPMITVSGIGRLLQK